MEIEYLSPLVPQFIYNVPNDQRCWQLVQPFVFQVDEQQFTVPAGFWTDFASVPRALWSLISPYDLGVGPVPHDFGYFTGHANQAYWDLVFLACMERDGVSKWRRNAAYRAVQWFGGWTWEKYRQRNQKRRLVEVIGRPRDWQIGTWVPRMTLDCTADVGQCGQGDLNWSQRQWQAEVLRLTY